MSSAARDETLLHRLQEVENASCTTLTGAPHCLELTEVIERVARHLEPPQSLPRDAGAVTSLNRILFQELQIRASQDLKDPQNLFPSRVFENRRGYCVGIVALYLLLAERFDLPIYAVATPSHVFLRYDDGTSRLNIETLQLGARVSNEQYIQEQKIPRASIAHGIFMRNLTVDEFLAQVQNNLGVIHSERKDYVGAAREYKAALSLDPRLAAAYYNSGNDSFQTNYYNQAIRLFSKALNLYPGDVWALNNRGLAYQKVGKKKKAKRDFERALEINPAFEQARRNLIALSP